MAQKDYWRVVGTGKHVGRVGLCEAEVMRVSLLARSRAHLLQTVLVANVTEVFVIELHVACLQVLHHPWTTTQQLCM